MRILWKKEDALKLGVDCEDDLFALSRIVQKGDVVSGISYRRFKTEGLRATSGEKKRIFVKLKIEDVKFSPPNLYLLGKIIEGTPEQYVEKGSFHSLEVSIGSSVTLTKKWDALSRELLDEAVKYSRQAKVLIVLIDERTANFFELKNSLIKKFSIHNAFSKKENSDMGNFYSKIFEHLENFKGPIIIGGPGFVAENFAKFFGDRSTKKLNLVHCSNTEYSGALELLRKGVIGKIINEQKLQKEFEVLESFKKEISTNSGLAVYGLGDVKKAAEIGAIDTLLISETFFRNAENIITLAKKHKARLVLFDPHDDAGKEFESFKIAALLRFKLHYQ